MLSVKDGLDWYTYACNGGANKVFKTANDLQSNILLEIQITHLPRFVGVLNKQVSKPGCKNNKGAKAED